MLDVIIGTLAPHHCYGCGQIGTTLCDSCKYNITEEPYAGCIECGKATLRGVCSKCQDAYVVAWCAGERHELLKDLLDGYKFSRQRSSYRVLTDILDETLPHMPAGTVVCSIPTAAAHIRMRGYDHAALIAKELAHRRGILYKPLLERNHHMSQRGAVRSERQKQASTAFRVAGRVSDVPYLLVDDIVTTGSTVRYAAKVLKNAGANLIMVAAIARQPLK